MSDDARTDEHDRHCEREYVADPLPGGWTYCGCADRGDAPAAPADWRRAVEPGQTYRNQPAAENILRNEADDPGRPELGWAVELALAELHPAAESVTDVAQLLLDVLADTGAPPPRLSTLWARLRKATGNVGVDR